jgi:hypothetical protein
MYLGPLWILHASAHQVNACQLACLPGNKMHFQRNSQFMLACLTARLDSLSFVVLGACGADVPVFEGNIFQATSSTIIYIQQALKTACAHLRPKGCQIQ